MAGTEETLGPLLLTLQAAGEYWELLTEAWDTLGCLTSDLGGSKTRSPAQQHWLGKYLR